MSSKQKRKMDGRVRAGARQSHSRVAHTASVCVLSLAAAACNTVEQDGFYFEGGNSPDPAATMLGTVTYSGPRPDCVRRPDGTVEQIKGNAILTMFDYGNPPAPEGTATSSLNLLVVSGDEIFQESDCDLPAGERITRAADFSWPRVPLYAGAPKAYQIRGFFDFDGDFLPFFAVTRIPTAGDIVGAALRDVQRPSAGMASINLPALEAATDGYIARGISVTLGEPVRTERPAFKLDENNRLAADAVFMPISGAAGLKGFRSLSCKAGSSTADCGLTLQRLGGAEDAEKLEKVGVELSLEDPTRYAFYAEPVDVTTVVADGPDVKAPDGKVDPHPFLAGLGINWYSPMLIMQRIQTPEETSFKIPRVLMIGSVLMDDSGVPTKKSYTSAPMAVAPVAAVELKADDSTCRVPYFPPGTISAVLMNRVAHCGELPTGRYAVNVLGGLAGGEVKPNADGAVHESGQEITGGRYSGQSWSLPNELGLEAQVRAENVLAHQGAGGAFVVHDPTPYAQSACTQGDLFAQCAGDYEANTTGVDAAKCLPRHCCEAVAHLYERELPRCEPGPDGIATTPTSSVGVGKNGLPIPNCLPFELPWQCRPGV